MQAEAPWSLWDDERELGFCKMAAGAPSTAPETRGLRVLAREEPHIWGRDTAGAEEPSLGLPQGCEEELSHQADPPRDSPAGLRRSCQRAQKQTSDLKRTEQSPSNLTVSQDRAKANLKWRRQPTSTQRDKTHVYQALHKKYKAYVECKKYKLIFYVQKKEFKKRCYLWPWRSLLTTMNLYRTKRHRTRSTYCTNINCLVLMLYGRHIRITKGK